MLENFNLTIVRLRNEDFFTLFFFDVMNGAKLNGLTEMRALSRKGIQKRILSLYVKAGSLCSALSRSSLLPDKLSG